jgi:redox-sensitive bicupin YhaK (pirin superfamily)
MSIQISPVIAASAWESGGVFSATSIKIHELGDRLSPIVVLDEARVRGRPFGPHPHAGFSALTYVFEDSQANARSRDSLGNDVVIGPGGIVWFQAARGAMHHEIPAEEGRELHVAQIFVNLSARHKFAEPRTFWLDRKDVPEWRNDLGDHVRVLVGSYEGVTSPLVPAEPIDLLDVDLRKTICFNLRAGHRGLMYVASGKVHFGGDDVEQTIPAEHAVGFHGGGPVTLAAAEDAHLLLLSGAEIDEPVVVDGPFIMNDRSQIEAAFARYRAGKMGRLAPLPND